METLMGEWILRIINNLKKVHRKHRKYTLMCVVVIVQVLLNQKTKIMRTQSTFIKLSACNVSILLFVIYISDSFALSHIYIMTCFFYLSLLNFRLTS